MFLSNKNNDVMFFEYLRIMKSSTFSSSVAVFSRMVSTNNFMSSTFTADAALWPPSVFRKGISLPLSLFKLFCRSYQAHQVMKSPIMPTHVNFVYLQQLKLLGPCLKSRKQGLKLFRSRINRRGVLTIQSKWSFVIKRNRTDLL